MPTATETTTVTVDTDFDGIVDANKEQFADLLEQKEAQRSFGDWVRSLPANARRNSRRLFEWLRLNKAMEFASTLWNRASGAVKRFLAPLRRIGFFNIFGALFTSEGGRKLLRKGASVAYTVVTAPIKYPARALGWLGRKIGLRKVVNAVEDSVHKAETWCAKQMNKALDWADRNEHHTAMGWARSIFQGAIMRGIIKQLPIHRNAKLALRIASWFLPNFGVGKKKGGVESRWDVVRGVDIKKIQVADAEENVVRAEAEVTIAKNRVKSAQARLAAAKKDNATEAEIDRYEAAVVKHQAAVDQAEAHVREAKAKVVELKAAAAEEAKAKAADEQAKADNKGKPTPADMPSVGSPFTIEYSEEEKKVLSQGIEVSHRVKAFNQEINKPTTIIRTSRPVMADLLEKDGKTVVVGEDKEPVREWTGRVDLFYTWKNKQIAETNLPKHLQVTNEVIPPDMSRHDRRAAGLE